MHPTLRECRQSTLGAAILILASCDTYNILQAFTCKLLMLLHISILPIPNTLPMSCYEASQLLDRLGFTYQPNKVLNRGANVAKQVCPECNALRKRLQGSSMVPFSVFCRFPLVPRQRRMFGISQQDVEMTWHVTHRSPNQKMRHTADSKQWHFIDSCKDWRTFLSEPRNWRLSLATDGIHPHSQKRSTHSLWPDFLLNHNIAPRMTTKVFFIMLSLLILGPRSVTGVHFDIYLELLVEELQ